MGTLLKTLETTTVIFKTGNLKGKEAIINKVDFNPEKHLHPEDIAKAAQKKADEEAAAQKKADEEAAAQKNADEKAAPKKAAPKK